MQVGPDTVVTIRAKIDIDGGQSQPPQVMSFIYGREHLLFDLDRRLEGLEAGQRASVELKPFGDHRPDLIRQVRVSDVIDAPPSFTPGERYDIRTKRGERLSLRFVKQEQDILFCDLNHPNAGRTMTISADILDVRAATPEELLASASRCSSS